MKILRSKRGFSLVELLTVIAIIAILAAIIFPVMAKVKESANQGKCMTQLHQIQLGLQMYKSDNHHYPKTLGPVSDGSVAEMQNDDKQDVLFKEYVKTIVGFHCPTSGVTNDKDTAQIPIYTPGSPANAVEQIKLYAYDSYDIFVKGAPPYTSANTQQRYAVKWARDIAEVATLSPYPSTGPNMITTDTTDIQQADYERQLQFRNPPENTLVTWCSYHEAASSKTLVVYLDGHTATLPMAETTACRWRTRQPM